MQLNFLSVHHQFEQKAQAQPHALAILDGVSSLTYAELNRQANSLAWHLMGLGVGPGVRVAVCLPRGFEVVVSFLAVLKSGGAFMPMDPLYPSDRRAHKFSDAQPLVLITESSLLSDMPHHLSQTLCLDDEGVRRSIAKLSADNPTPIVSGADIAYIIYTSGSTGKPKGVMISHTAMASHGSAITRHYGLAPEDRALQFSSLAFDISIEEIFPTLACGATLVIRNEACSNSVQAFCSFVDHHAVTVVNIPTAFWHELVFGLDLLGGRFPSTVRLLIVGGEKASRAAYTRWAIVVGAHPRFLNAYGPTETTVTATVYEPLACKNDACYPELPIGQPLSNTRAYILDTELKPVSSGEVGELFIGGSGVGSGYLNLPDLTASVFLPDPFSDHEERENARMYRTGDRARWLPDANIEFLGRTDHQIKVRGFRVESSEVEASIELHPAIQQAVVLGVSDTSGNTQLHAHIVFNDDYSGVVDQLRAFLNARLPDYMIPGRIIVHASLPMLPNGKVDREALANASQARDLEPLDCRDSEVALLDGIEALLEPLFSEVLGIPDVDPETSFFDLGGHSLMALRLVSILSQRRPDIQVSLELLFANPSVRQLASALRDGGFGTNSTAIRLNRRNPSIEAKTPLFCVCGVALYSQLAHVLQDNLPVYGTYLPMEATSLHEWSQLDVRQMAERYIEIILRERPEGPYSIGGFSFGAMVAHEIAQQMRGRGMTVELLLLLDGLLNRSLGAWATIERASRAWRQFRHAAALAVSRNKPRLPYHGAPAAEGGGEGDFGVIPDLLVDRAADEHEARMVRYDGAALIVTACGPDGPREDLGRWGRFASPDLGWHSLVPRDSPVVGVKAGHAEILQAPSVLKIAEAVRASLHSPQTQH